MIGPTGVGKTEIARRLAKLAQAPFVKVEASKFTEVGYVGRDVESIIRDLIELAITMVREEEKEKVRVRARELAEERLLDLLLPPARAERRVQAVVGAPERADAAGDDSATREKLRRMLREGKLDDRTVEVEVTKPASPMIEVMTPQGMEEIELNLQGHAPEPPAEAHQEARSMRVPEALDAARARRRRRKLIDMEAATRGGDPPRRAVGHRLHRRDRQDRRPRGRARARRLARGRAARPAADRRGLDGDDQVRPGADRPRPLHRRRRVPHRQAVRPDPRVPGPLPDPRRARAAHPGRLRPHPDRAGERAHPPVHGAARDRGRARSSSATTRSPRSRASPPR